MVRFSGTASLVASSLLLAGLAAGPAASQVIRRPYVRTYRRIAQPRMQIALRSLRSARVALLAAPPDKGGHRARALRLVDQAIVEARRGIRYGLRY